VRDSFNGLADDIRSSEMPNYLVKSSDDHPLRASWTAPDGPRRSLCTQRWPDTELGRQQAAQRIASLNPDASFTSNVAHAIETADNFFSITSQQVHQIPNLAELNTGNIWATPVEFKRQVATGDYQLDYKSIGGETISEFRSRVRNGFAELLQTSASRRLNVIAAFLHEGVIGTIIDHLEGRDQFDSKRREMMPYSSPITVDTESNAPHFPGFWDTDHLDVITG
jgi:broad specificity phosphatase PhoE